MTDAHAAASTKEATCLHLNFKLFLLSPSLSGLGGRKLSFSLFKALPSETDSMQNTLYLELRARSKLNILTRYILFFFKLLFINYEKQEGTHWKGKWHEVH